MDVNVIALDGIEYLIIDALEIDDNKYLILANEKDDLDMCIRKVIIEDGKEFLDKLEDEEEFEKVMTSFEAKHMNGDNNDKR